MKEIMQNGTISGFSDPAARLVRKGSNFESLFCGLSPPVSGGRSLARIYTFWPSRFLPACNDMRSDIALLIKRKLL